MLPKPDYERDGIRLYCADCLDLLPMIGDGEVNAVVTDPPYGVEFADWDGTIPPWFDVIRPIAKSVVFTTAPTTLWDYPRPDWLCCWYRPASSSRSLGGGFNHWSPVAVYGDYSFAVDTINLHAIANAYPSGFKHPSPKPEALMTWCVGMTTGVVLDLFMGSGTTAVACVKLGRQCIGIEKERKYFDIAVKRVEQAFADQALIADVPTVYVQTTMQGME